MSDFSDRPFVAGSITGLRSFRVDKLGRLAGVSYPYIFTPGENTAACHASEDAWGASPMSSYYALLGLRRPSSYGVVATRPDLVSQITATAPGVATTPRVKPEHHVAQEKCGCGYYAYFDGGSNPYHDEDDNVLALVEGYGTVTVGERGFRAEKAKLVALIDPAPKPVQSWRHPRWFDWMADHSNSVTGGLGIVGGPLGLAFAIATVASGTLLGALLLIPAFVAGAWGTASFHGISRNYPTVHDLSRCHDGGRKTKNRRDSRPDFALVQRNYPDVPVYSSLSAALKAHPVTPPPVPVVSPETCEDFWTRSAR